MVKKIRLKILLIGLTAVLLFLPQTTLFAATKSHIGDPCINDITNADCEVDGADLDCEKSNKKDATKYCTANSDSDCIAEYGTPAKGSWVRSSGTDYTYNLAYCYNSATKEVKTAAGINTDVSPIGNLVGAVFDSPATQAALLEEVKSFKPGLEIRLPGLTFSDLSNTIDEEGYLHIPWIGEFIKALYNFGLVIVSIVAVVMIIMQGAKIVVSGGESKVEGYKKIGQIAIGLVIAWGSYAILYTINPALVEFESLKVRYIQPDKLEQYNEYVNPSDASPIITGGASTFGANGIPDFKQCDSRWKDLPYDGVYKGKKLGCFRQVKNKKNQYEGSICTSGCGVTSLADVLVYYGYSNITPVDTARYAVEIGARSGCNGSIGSLLCNKIATKWPDLKCNNINPQKEISKIVSLLREKKPVVFSCHDCHGFTKTEQDITFEAHYLVLTGVDDSGNWFSVNDPGRQSGMVRISAKEFAEGRVATTFAVEKKDGSTANTTNGECVTISATFSATQADCLAQDGTWQPQ